MGRSVFQTGEAYASRCRWVNLFSPLRAVGSVSGSRMRVGKVDQ
jgi:hypothetical protein